MVFSASHNFSGSGDSAKRLGGVSNSGVSPTHPSSGKFLPKPFDYKKYLFTTVPARHGL
jgi:hypothetical protein